MNKLINFRGKIFDFSRPWVMGILNITPDSFYAKSRVNSVDTIREAVGGMISSGVDLIDIGAYSSRPGADNIAVEEEIERLRMALDVLCKYYPEQLLSLDTFRSEVARFAIENYGIDIVNDISGGSMDKDMIPLIAEKNIPYILMHMRGTPQDMQTNPFYDNVVNEIINWFSKKIDLLVSHGIKDIIIDPGFGFGKSIDHNYELLENLQKFEIFERPILVGLSRKSMIWKALDISPEDSLPGSIALNSIALQKGANIIRVHDIKEAVQTVRVCTRASK